MKWYSSWILSALAIQLLRTPIYIHYDYSLLFSGFVVNFVVYILLLSLTGCIEHETRVILLVNWVDRAHISPPFSLRRVLLAPPMGSGPLSRVIPTVYPHLETSHLIPDNMLLKQGLVVRMIDGCWSPCAKNNNSFRQALLYQTGEMAERSKAPA